MANAATTKEPEVLLVAPLPKAQELFFVAGGGAGFDGAAGLAVGVTGGALAAMGATEVEGAADGAADALGAVDVLEAARPDGIGPGLPCASFN